MAEIIIEQKEPNQLLKLNESNSDGVITFTNDILAEEIMLLDKDGMIYKGKRIEDAGEAHRLFIEVLKMMKERK